MKIRALFIVSAMMTVGIVSLAQAGEKKLPPVSLADITPLGCSYEQIAPFNTSLVAKWEWQAGEFQTKFGGDAKFEVSASIDGGENWEDMEMEFEVEQYERGTLAEDYAGTLVYRCSNIQTDLSGTCNGSVLGVRDAILNAATVELLGEDGDRTVIGGNIRATLIGVYVKAMNPGKGKGHQNYPLTDVCDVSAVVPL